MPSDTIFGWAARHALCSRKTPLYRVSADRFWTNFCFPTKSIRVELIFSIVSLCVCVCETETEYGHDLLAGDEVVRLDDVKLPANHRPTELSFPV